MTPVKIPAKFVSYIETQREDQNQMRINSGRLFYFPCNRGEARLSEQELSYFASLFAEDVLVGTEYHNSFGMCDVVFVPKKLEIEFS